MTRITVVETPSTIGANVLETDVKGFGRTYPEKKLKLKLYPVKFWGETRYVSIPED